MSDTSDIEAAAIAPEARCNPEPGNAADTRNPTKSTFGQDPDSTTLTGPISGEDYIEVLLARQAAYVAAAHPLKYLPLLEWFIRDEDHLYVVLPEVAPAPKRTPKPRVYRTAESIRADLEKVDTRLAAIAGNGPTDRAAANLSPRARSRAAARAGRIRFDRMDRDLQQYTALKRRRDQLAARLTRAEAHEKRAAADLADRSTP